MNNKLEVKLVAGRLVIDLNSELEHTLDGMTAQAYDGTPNKYDICTLGPALVIGTIELSEEWLERIQAEYENGGQCGWCDEIRPKLREPHIFDHARDGSKMCEHCWNHDREMYKGANGYDIGPFDQEAEEETEDE